MMRRSRVATSLFVLPALAGALYFASLQAGPPDDAVQATVARLVAHYEQVERELLAADVADLTPAQQAARTRAIGELRTYRRARDFTVNIEHPGARVPVFVDHEGRRCAVAHLLHRFGRDDLVEHVATTDNGAYVSDLADVAPFRTWLDSVGLSLTEAVRIQAPGPNPIDMEDPEEEGETISVGDGDEDEPVVVTSLPSRPSGSAPSTVGGAATRRRARGSSAGFGAGDWWRWWEMNKLDWMRPNVLRSKQGSLKGETYPVSRLEADERALALRREQALPALLEGLSHEDARVRSAACVAAARVGGALAVPRLTELLDDPQPTVRNRALIALGVTGSDRAAGLLLSVARTGKLPRKKKTVSDDARPVAVIALALARRYGLELAVDAEITELLDDMKRRDELDVGTAAVLYGVLSPSDRLDQVAEHFAGRRNTVLPLQARAMERIPRSVGAKALKPLQSSLAGRRVELRRSAAVALGGVESDLVLPRLMTAYELEEEALTRGFLLLSIAERGGAEAVPFLREQALSGPQRLRPWAALGLGMVGSLHDVEDARETLRRIELSRRDEGARMLAQGMARDHSVLPKLSKELAEADNPATRLYAATALGLLGGDRARYALLECARTEKVPYVRVVIAQGLGLIGHTADAAEIVKTMHATRDPALQPLLSVALGFHGTEVVLDETLVVLRDPELPVASRAMALEAVGVLLDREPGLALPHLSRRTNFTVMPDWLEDLLSIPL